MAKKDYRGFPEPLMTPLRRRRRLGLLSTVASDPEWQLEFRDRFLVLIAHYGLAADDPNLWPSLAYKLAVEFVPGLQEAPPERRGRPRSRFTAERRKYRRDLLEEARKLREQRAHLTDTAICKTIRTRWKKRKPPHPLSRLSERTFREELKLAKLEARQERKSLGLFLAPPPVHTVAHSLTGEALPNADNNTEESEKERPVGLLSLLDGEKSDA